MLTLLLYATERYCGGCRGSFALACVGMDSHLWDWIRGLAFRHRGLGRPGCWARAAARRVGGGDTAGVRLEGELGCPDLYDLTIVQDFHCNPRATVCQRKANKMECHGPTWDTRGRRQFPLLQPALNWRKLQGGCG